MHPGEKLDAFQAWKEKKRATFTEIGRVGLYKYDENKAQQNLQL